MTVIIVASYGFDLQLLIIWLLLRNFKLFYLLKTPVGNPSEYPRMFKQAKYIYYELCIS